MFERVWRVVLERVWCSSAYGVRARMVFEREVQILTFIIHLLMLHIYHLHQRSNTGTVSVVADDTTQCILEDKSQWFVMRLKISRTEMIIAAPTERERSKWIKSFRKVSLWKKSKQLRDASSSSSSTKKIVRHASSEMKNRSSNEDDEELMTTNRKASSEFDPQSMITSVFEPHIVRFVRSNSCSLLCMSHSLKFLKTIRYGSRRKRYTRYFSKSLRQHLQDVKSLWILTFTKQF